MSPTTSNACNSNVYDVQSEKRLSRKVKVSSNSCCPYAFRKAPRMLTGSLRDQSARRGAASPLCTATSASYSADLTQARKSSRSVMPQHATAQRLRTGVTAESVPAPTTVRDLRRSSADHRSLGRLGESSYRVVG